MNTKFKKIKKGKAKKKKQTPQKTARNPPQKKTKQRKQRQQQQQPLSKQMEEGKGRAKGNGDIKRAEARNPKLQQAYAFWNELALGLDQRP